MIGKYEIRSLLRDRWIQALTLILLTVCLFAGYNGRQKVDQRIDSIRQARAEVAAGDSAMLVLIDSLERGLPVDVPSWRRPTYPQVVGNAYPRVAAMPAAPLAMVATGQSDLYSHYVKPVIRGDELALDFTELSSPVQLLFGSFDLAFVIVYLLPLLAIAFTYNILSGEREQGVLALLASQPLSLVSWLSWKTGLRLAILWLTLLVALLLSLWINGARLSLAPAATGQLIVLVTVYLLFWFALAFFVNLSGRSSARNAITLLACWVVLVVILPSVVSQVAGSLYPVPSRARMVNDLRIAQVEAGKQQDEILDEFLRNHPELGGMSEDANSFWTRFFASQEVVERKMQPLITDFNRQLDRQQQLIHTFRIASPAIIVQNHLNELAHTSTRHYRDYRRQVIEFARSWRAFFLPMIFENRMVTQATVEHLPKFSYQPPDGAGIVSANIWLLLAYPILLSAAALWRTGRRPLAVFGETGK